MSLFNRNINFIKRVVYNSNVNREKFHKNKKIFQLINKRKLHSFYSGGPQGDGPDLLYIFIIAATAYFIVKKR
jgi:hypothetical protein